MFWRKRPHSEPDFRPDTADADAAPDKPDKKKKRRSVVGWVFHKFIWTLVFLFTVILIARPFMPRALRWYVNRTLDKSQVYRGKIGDVELHLWKGSYSIHEIQLNKLTGDVPVPLFASPRVEFA